MKRILAWVAVLAAFVLVGASIPQRSTAQVPSFYFGAQACSFQTSVVTTTETALATSIPLSTQGARSIYLHGQAVITAGTGATAFTLHIRRGSGTGGADVTTPTQVSATAGSQASYDFTVIDTPGEVAGQQYTLTVKPIGASGNSTVQTCTLQYAAY